MFKKLSSLAIVIALFHLLNAAPALAAKRVVPQDTALAKIKADVAKHEQKHDKVLVKLKDGTKLKGRITQHDEDAFSVTDAKSGATRSLMYTEVAQVKSAGGLSLAAKVGIGIGIGVGALALTYAIGKANCHTFACP